MNRKFANTKSPDNDLMIIVPTHERPNFLARKLRYLEIEACKAKILILDTSLGENQNKNSQAVSNHSAKLDIDYHSLPRSNHFARKLRKGCLLSEKSYTFFSFDDDFSPIDVLREGVVKLDKNPAFTSANGQVLSLPKGKNSEIPRVPVIGKSFLSQDENPIIRIKEFLASTRRRNPLFNLWRTRILKEIWSPIPDVPWTKFIELLFDILAISSGPTILLDRIFEFRHIDYNRQAYTSQGLPKFSSGLDKDVLDPSLMKGLADSATFASKWFAQQAALEKNEAEEYFIRSVLALVAGRLLAGLRVPPSSFISNMKPDLPQNIENFARRMWKLKRILELGGSILKHPKHLFLLISLTKIYERDQISDMLVLDPKLRFNHLTLTRLINCDAEAYGTVQKVLTEFPETTV